MVRSIVLGAVSALAMIASANASDLYRASEPAVYNDGPYTPNTSWAGFYVGVNGGFASLESRFVETPGVNVLWGQPGDRFKTQPDDGFGGGQIGYNFQRGNVVFGLEGTFEGISAASLVRSPRFPATELYASDISAFGTLAGRLGYAFDRNLIYAKGGYAVTDLMLRGRRGGVNYFNTDETLSGFVLGGGVEHRILPRWTLGVEYNYLDFRSQGLEAGDNAGLGFKSEAGVAAQTVAGRLSYTMGAVYEPLK